MVKRRDLERWLSAHGCSLVRNGANHDIWKNQDGTRRSTVARHREIPRTTARAICEQLGIDQI